jgi:hypothetical protein
MDTFFYNKCGSNKRIMVKDLQHRRETGLVSHSSYYDDKILFKDTIQEIRGSKNSRK